MLNLEITGVIVFIGDTQQVTEKFIKREFAIDVEDGQYSQTIKMQFTGERCSKLDKFNAGSNVTVKANLRGRAYAKGGETMYFNSIEAWYIKEAGTDDAPAPAPAPVAKPKQAPAPLVVADHDDLPF